MQLSKLALRTAYRSVLTFAFLVIAVLLASPAAQAAGPRPLFQMPFPCGQTWEASTYDGHWPDQDSIDLAERDDDGDNISEGEPVLASAAGTVDQVFDLGNGAHTVFLDHGGDWATYYVHLEEVPPLTVGQFVAQGEQIGRTSNSGIEDAGIEDMHLHYSQVKDGDAVRIEFNGTPIDTHAGNDDSYKTWGTDDAEKLTSLNCPGNSFMGFNQNGMRYELLYKPGTGATKIVRVDADGTGVTTTYSDTWTKGYTHLTPFSLVGGQQHAFIYKSSTGLVRFLRMSSQGGGVTTLASGTWGEGWTHFAPFSIGGHPYYTATRTSTASTRRATARPPSPGARGRRAGRRSCRSLRTPTSTCFCTRAAAAPSRSWRSPAAATTST